MKDEMREQLHKHYKIEPHVLSAIEKLEARIEKLGAELEGYSGLLVLAMKTVKRNDEVLAEIVEEMEHDRV